MTFSIRPMTKADIKPMVGVCTKTNVVCYRDILPSEAIEGYNASGMIDQHFEDHLDTTLIVEQDGKVVAGGTHKDNAVLLMMVDLDLHRAGVGSILLNSLEDILFRQHDTITLDCFRDNDQAVNFYKKHGWKMVGEKEEHGIPHIVMEKAQQDF